MIDSATIRLSSDNLKGVDRNPKGDGKKKRGLKGHMLIDVVQSVGRFIKITAARVYDQKLLKCNAMYTVIEEKLKYYQKKGIVKVLRDEIIELEYHPEDETGKKQVIVTRRIRLRKVCCQDEKNRYYEFLTNSFGITAEVVAFLYKKRWGIELQFKKMRQNFQLHYFYGENENAIRTRVWCTLIAQQLLTVIQKIAQTKKAFSVVASLF